MCTLVLAWQVFADAPVVAAANRDERLDRPAERPAVLKRDPPVLAPRDAEAGGTWIGVNEAGVLVAIANRWTESPIPGERSRGLLVRDALQHETAEAASRMVERALDERQYAGFNLVLADAAAAVYLEWDGETHRVRNFDPGIHVVVNVGADGRYEIPDRRGGVAREQAENADAVARALQPEPGESSSSWRARAADVISDHEFGVCVHGDGFGTRSSSLITIGEDGTRYQFADGPPCETPYRDVNSQI